LFAHEVFSLKSELTMSNPSFLNVPYRFKAGTLYSQIPESGLGDLTVTRATTPTANLSTRVNASGFIELVANNVPRLDYPLGGIANGCPALLVEPSAQNLALQSENFGTTWSSVALLAFGSGSVLNTTATLDPYGTNVADLIVANTSVTQHRVDQTTVSAAGSYTFSIFLKAAGYGFARLRIGGTGAIFNLTTGVVSATDTGIVSSIQSYGNGWYRCIASKAVSVANEIIRVNVQSTQSSADFGGDGTSGIYIFGSQYELGAVATSYIPTTTAAITRGAEAVNKTGVSSLIGQTEGTIYAEVDLRALSVARSIFGVSLNSNTTDFANIQINASNRIFARIRSNTGTLQDITASSTITGITKIAMAYGSSGSVLAINGAIIGTNPSGIPTWASSVNFVHVGNGPSAVSGSTQGGFFNDCIRSSAIYSTRLTDTQLQALTT
jgi:hypothetical protein